MMPGGGGGAAGAVALPARVSLAGKSWAEVARVYGTRAAVWVSLFLISACLHAAEIAITTLYPWKVREFARKLLAGPTLKP